MKEITAFFSTFFICLLIAVPVFSETPLPEEEQSESLFDLKLGDAPVSLFYLGSWDLNLAGGVSFGFDGTTGDSITAAFPGISEGFVFSQTPDFTLSLWLMDRFFFETTILEDFAFNTFLLGYTGNDDEFIREVRIGNRDLGISSYPFLDFGEGNSHTFGGRAYFASSISDHEVLFRMNQVGMNQMEFFGLGEVQKEKTDPGIFIEGIMFQLPDQSIDSLTVYRQKWDGELTGTNGLNYTIVPQTEYVADLKNGILQFLIPAKAPICVYYEKSGKSIGDPSLGMESLPDVWDGALIDSSHFHDFNWTTSWNGIDWEDRAVDIENRKALIIYQPGRFTPFAVSGIYPLTLSSPDSNVPITAGFYSENTTGPAFLTEVLEGEEQQYLRIYHPDREIDDPRQRFPLLFNRDYYLLKTLSGADYLEFSAVHPVEEYLLEPDIVPGSVQIWINGRKVKNFNLEPSSGLITFANQPGPNDHIKVLYRTQTDSGEGNDLVFGIGNTIQLLPGFNGSLNTGLRWNIASDSHSKPDENRSGTFVTSASLNYSNQSIGISAELAGGLSFNNPDTSGTLRMEGMESETLSPVYNDSDIFPAAPSEIVRDDLTFTRETRGILYYKNYFAENFGAVVLQNETWDIPSENQPPYADESRPGPYLVNSDISETAMVLDYQLTSEQYWAGAQIPLGEFPLNDLRGMNFFWKSEGSSTGLKVLLTIGHNGEDLDGDKILDQEQNEFGSGYSFNHNDLLLRIGGGPNLDGNNRRDSEDLNSNGILDNENQETLGIFDLTPPTGNTWKKQRILISPQTAANLPDDATIRIILYDPGLNDSTGKLTIGPIELDGILFNETTSSEQTSWRQIEEKNALSAPKIEDQLINRYPEIADPLLSDTVPQKVLEVYWNNKTDQTVEAAKHYSSFTPADYRYFHFYLRNLSDEAEKQNLILTFGNPADPQFKLAFTPGKLPNWTKWTYDMQTGVLSSNGTEYPLLSGSVPVPSSEECSRLTITVTGTESGLLYLDELYFTETSLSFSGGGEMNFTWTIPAPPLTVNGFPLIGGFFISQEASVYGPQFAGSFYSESGEFTYQGATRSELTLLGFGIRAGFLFSGRTDFFGSGGEHEIFGPAGFSWLQVKDSYKRTYNENGVSQSASTELTSSYKDFYSFKAERSYGETPDSFKQSWSASISGGYPDRFSAAITGNYQSAFQQSVNTTDHYFSDWINGYSMILPSDAGHDATNSGLIQFTAHGKGAVVQPALSISLSQLSKDLPIPEQQQTNDLSLELPFSWSNQNEQEQKVSIKYERSSQTLYPLSATGIREEFSLWQTQWPYQPLVRTIPFYDFFDPDLQETLQNEARNQGFTDSSWSTMIETSYSRASGSYLSDLFIPGTVSFSLDRQWKKQKDSYTDQTTIQSGLHTKGINLFGQKGTQNLTDFYDSDEFSWGIALQAAEQEKQWQWQSTLSLNLLFIKDESWEWLSNGIYTQDYSEDQRFSIDMSHRYSWNTRIDLKKGKPFLNRTLSTLPFTHSEELKFTMNHSVSEGTSVLLNIHHKSELLLKSWGTVSAFASAGYQFTGNRDLSESIHIIGLSGGISAKITF